MYNSLLKYRIKYFKTLMTIKYSTICVCITLNLSSYLVITFFLGFLGGSDGEESACSTGDLV